VAVVRAVSGIYRQMDLPLVGRLLAGPEHRGFLFIKTKIAQRRFCVYDPTGMELEPCGEKYEGNLEV